MFIRIVRPQVQPGRAEEMAEKWKEFAGSRIKERPGFRSGYMAATADRSAVVAVTLWDELPDAATTQQFQSEIRAHMGDISTGPPTTDDYEVLAKI